MKASRITAVGLVAATALWILSGYLIPHESAESKAALQAGEAKPEKRFRVAVIDTNVVSHSRKLMLSGRTEADRKVVTFARTNGLLQELKVRRGSHVKKGDVIAILSDDAREAQVQKAKAQLDQRTVELEAKRKLVATNAIPKLDLNVLEAQHKAAEAALATAEAERDRGVITRAVGWRHHRDFARSAHRRSPSPARRSPRSSASIRCSPWSRCPSARSPTSRSATWPR